MGIGFTYQYQDSGNERSKRKRMRLLGRIRNVCPHIHTLNRTSDDAGNPAVAVQYAFETFFGTLDYFCMMCGSQWSQHRIGLFQDELMTASQHDFSGTTRDILNRSKQTQKLIRKLNRRGGVPSKGGVFATTIYQALHYESRDDVTSEPGKTSPRDGTGAAKRSARYRGSSGCSHVE